jgi:hypothetical protein
MQSLLPEVSLEEDLEEESEQSNSSAELQNSSSTEESNSSTAQDSAQATSQTPPQASTPATGPEAHASEEATSTVSPASAKTNASDHSLEVLPPERPNLKQKLGPYVSQEVDEALEEVYLLLRRRLSGKASKSLIVEAALRYALSDYLQRGEESEVAKWLKVVLED